MWDWIQRKHPNKYSSEREFLAVRASLNKLTSWGWLESWLTFSGQVVDFGNKAYSTRACISNIYAMLCMLEKMLKTVSNEDLRLVFWEATKLMLPMSKKYKEKTASGRSPGWILDKASPAMVGWLATPMNESAVYGKVAKSAKKAKPAKPEKPARPQPKRAAANAAKLAAKTATTTSIVEDLTTCMIKDGGIERAIYWLSCVHTPPLG